jgi:hypothetical protein
MNLYVRLWRSRPVRNEMTNEVERVVMRKQARYTILKQRK